MSYNWSGSCIQAVCVGKMGVSVAEHLHLQAIKDLVLIAVDTGSTALWASTVPTKFAFDNEAQSANSDAVVVRELTNALKSCAITIVVADLNDPVSQRLVPTLVESLNVTGQFCMAAIVKPSELTYSPRAMAVLEKIPAITKSFALVNQRSGTFQLPIYKLGQLVKELAELVYSIQSDNDVDNVRQLMKKPGQFAVVGGLGAGVDRVEKAYEGVKAMLSMQLFDSRYARKILLIISSSSQQPTTFEEQQLIVRKLTDQMEAEAQVFKIGYIIDDAVHDKLRIDLILWKPTEIAGTKAS